MKSIRALVLAAWVGVGLIELPLEAQAPAAGDAWVQVAEQFIRKMEAGDFAGAASMAGPQMVKAGVTAAMLEQNWKLISGSGPLKELRFDTGVESGGFKVVEFIGAFGGTSLRLRISLDAEKRVEGFRLLPVAAAVPWTAPAYANAAAVEEIELTVGAEGWPLGATLTVPKGVARAPVVVLVHGSGAHDRDETIGPNKPFKDLALGLAARGVATLRYEKRNWKHAARMQALTSFTIEDEVVADALAALQQVRMQPRVDASQVYLLGHSLGGMLAPEIAARDGKLAGVILLAGSPRRLSELVLDQVAYLRTLPGADAQRAQFDTMRVQMERIERREVPAQEIVMGAPASYYYDLAQRDPRAFLPRVKAKLLILQGGRDYQVTAAKDLELYRAALRERENVTFRLYDDLSHLFAPGKGTAVPSEYGVASHIDERVIADISAFVSGR